MEERIIKVFYNQSCLPFKDKERTVHFSIVGNAFMGASNTTEIRFYADKIGGNTRQWVCIGKLPNGKRGFKTLPSAVYDEEVGEYYLPFQLSSFFLQYKGELFLSLGGYNGNFIQLNEEQEYELVGNTLVETTSPIRINVAYSVLISGSDEDIDTWEDFLSALGEKLDINKSIVVIPNTSASVSGYQAGQLFYSKSDNKLYVLNNNALELFVDPAENNIGLLTLSMVSGTLNANQLIEVNKKQCLIYLDTSLVKNCLVKKSISGNIVTFYGSPSFSTISNNYTIFSYWKLVVNTSTGEYSTSTEQSSYYGKDQADLKFASLSGNNTFTGLNTFVSNLPQSQILATNSYDLITLAKALLLQQESKNYVDEKIAELQAKSDVIDVLGNIDELKAYDTEEVAENDIINVLSDNLHENASTFYKLKEPQEGDIYVEPTTPDSRGYVWVYVGEEGPFLTPNEADSKYQTKIIGYPLLNIAISDWVQDQETGKWYYTKVVSATDLTVGANDKYMLGGNDKATSNELAECEINIDTIVTSGANTTITLVGDFVPTIPLNVSIVIAKVSPTTYGGVTFITTSDIDTDYLVIENGKLTVSQDIKALLVYAKGQGWID